MDDGTRLAEARKAAKTLANQLLDANDPTNPTNNVAVVSFGYGAETNTGFSNNKTTVSNAIDTATTYRKDYCYDINFLFWTIPTCKDAGTFTQGGMREARKLIENRPKENIKNIILLSDGEPTYSYGFTNTIIDNLDSYNNYFEYFDNTGFPFYNDEYQTKANTIPESAFSNERVGDGSLGYMPCVDTNWFANIFGVCSSHKYYNHGNSTILEASYYKNKKVGNLYAIALDAGANGSDILQKMSSGSGFYTATTDAATLNGIFNNIAGEIKNSINNASIVDTMGDAIVVSGTNSKTINIPNLVFKEGKSIVDGKDCYYWEDTYTVEANSDQSSTQVNGNFLLNKEAKLTYYHNNQKQEAYFPTPAVSKPMAIKVSKNVINNTGTADQNAKFEITISGPTGFTSETVKLEGGESQDIVKAFPKGTYTVAETAKTGGNSKIKLENYHQAFSYTVGNSTNPVSSNKFDIDAGQDDDVNVVVQNTYETVDYRLEKRWDDDGDRDGLRQEHITGGADAIFYLVIKETKTGKIVGAAEIYTPNPSDYYFSLPKWRDNKEISYEVDEMIDCKSSNVNNELVTTCDNYEKQSDYKKSFAKGTDGTYTVYTFTNTHTPETINVSVSKTWLDDGNRDGLRLPGQVDFCIEGKGENGTTVVKLCTDDTITRPYTASKTIFQTATQTHAVDDILAKFGKLPKYQPGKQGVPVQYTVTEKMGKLQDYTTSIPNGYIITTSNSIDVANTHDPYKRDIKAQIAWDDDGDTTNRPASVWVTLESTGTKQAPTPATPVTPAIEVDENGPKQIIPGVIESCGSWCATFKDRYVNENGQEIQYQVSQATPTGHDAFYAGDMANGFTITNARQYNMEAVINWDDNNNQYNSRPTFMRIILEGDDGNSYSATVDQNGAQATRAVTIGKCSTQQAWCAAFKNIPRARVLNGAVVPITYKLKQDPAIIPNYITSIVGNVANGFSVNNTYQKPVVPSPSPSNGFGAALSPDTGFNTKTTEGSKASSNFMVLSAIPAMLAVVGMSALVATIRRKK